MIEPRLTPPTLAALAFFLLLAGCSAPPPADGPSDLVGDRKVVALVADARASAAVRAAADAEGYRWLETIPLPGLDLTMLSFETPPGVAGADAIAALEEAVPGSTVGVNHAYRLQQGQATPATLDYANAMMGWPEDGCPAVAPIGVIDTGIDAAAPALTRSQIVERAFFSGAPSPATHGTLVASVLSGEGRLRDPTIYGANVFGQDEALGLVAGADALVRALDWMADQQVRFVNLALAGPYNKLLDLAVGRAADRGLILVAAVGNDGPDAEPMYPAGFDGVIAVTAVDSAGRVYRNAVQGAHVDVAAPGVDVLVRAADGGRFVTGTSIATPFVTARLAADPTLAARYTVSDARARLAATSAELGPAGRDASFGYGLAKADDVCTP
ncbi:MAG: S8 family serine peptidase [Pseudomonadota bacterium]